MWLGIALLGILLVSIVIGIVTRKPPYACPPGKTIAATVRRHSEAGPMLVVLSAAGMDAQVVEETAKPLWRRLPHLLYAWYPPHEPQGPWHVVVDEAQLAEAQRLLGATA
jgi:hypothetical protein